MLVSFECNQTLSSPKMEMTDDEREQMKVFEQEREATFDKHFQYKRLHEPSLVLDDFLFLGNIQHASNETLLTKFQIKHIINVCDLKLSSQIHDNFDVIHISMADVPHTDIKQHFDRTNELLHSFFEKKERCLVHCAAGVSRSATIVLAYLMKYHHNTLKDAFNFLFEKRPQIWPNEGFILQLLRYEKNLLQSKEIVEHKETNPLQTLEEFEENKK